MRKLLLSLIALAGLAGFASVAQAECGGHVKQSVSAESDAATVATGTTTPILLPNQSGG